MTNMVRTSFRVHSSVKDSIIFFVTAMKSPHAEELEQGLNESEHLLRLILELLAFDLLLLCFLSG